MYSLVTSLGTSGNKHRKAFPDTNIKKAFKITFGSEIEGPLSVEDHFPNRHCLARHDVLQQDACIFIRRPPVMPMMVSAPLPFNGLLWKVSSARRSSSGKSSAEAVPANSVAMRWHSSVASTMQRSMRCQASAFSRCDDKILESGQK